MLLKDLLTPDVASCPSTATALEAARLMRGQHTGDLVVVDDTGSDRVPIGVITDRDIVVEVLAQDLNPATTPVRSLLRTPVVIAHEQEDVADALERMKRHGVRRIPIVDHEGKLTGIVTLDDVLKWISTDLSALADVLARGQNREQRTRR